MEREDLRQRLGSPTATPSPKPRRPSSARPTAPMLSRPSRPASRPTSAQRPRMEPQRAVPDPACIPLPRCVRRYSRPNPFGSKLYIEKGQKQSEALGSPETQSGCRSAPAGIAVARGEANGHKQITIDPLGIFPIDGLRRVWLSVFTLLCLCLAVVLLDFALFSFFLLIEQGPKRHHAGKRYLGCCSMLFRLGTLGVGRLHGRGDDIPNRNGLRQGFGLFIQHI